MQHGTAAAAGVFVDQCGGYILPVEASPAKYVARLPDDDSAIVNRPASGSFAFTRGVGRLSENTEQAGLDPVVALLGVSEPGYLLAPSGELFVGGL